MGEILIKEYVGKVVKGVGGLYETRALIDGEPVRLTSRAKGILKRDEDKVIIGDLVRLTEDEGQEGSIVISEILERKNSLIRPPVSNLDYLFIVLAAKKPAPVIETVDKLISIAEHNGITPVVVITKTDLSDTLAVEYAEIYKRVGIDTFITSSESGVGIPALRDYISTHVVDGMTAAFAGASGVGKSTLMNSIFADLSLKTGDVSHKIERGKHTTRHVEIFDIGGGGFLADTPGFSLVDFARFDFMEVEELFPTFREFLPYLGKCRYSDCAHFGESEEECAIARAVSLGEIPESRLSSYRAIYDVLRRKNKYD